VNLLFQPHGTSAAVNFADTKGKEFLAVRFHQPIDTILALDAKTGRAD
jgi:hypothetical protein